MGRRTGMGAETLRRADLEAVRVSIGRELRTAKWQIIVAWLLGQGIVTVTVLADYILLSGAHP